MPAILAVRREMQFAVRVHRRQFFAALRPIDGPDGERCRYLEAMTILENRGFGHDCIGVRKRVHKFGPSGLVIGGGGRGAVGGGMHDDRDLVSECQFTIRLLHDNVMTCHVGVQTLDMPAADQHALCAECDHTSRIAARTERLPKPSLPPVIPVSCVFHEHAVCLRHLRISRLQNRRICLQSSVRESDRRPVHCVMAFAIPTSTGAGMIYPNFATDPRADSVEAEQGKAGDVQADIALNPGIALDGAAADDSIASHAVASLRGSLN